MQYGLRGITRKSKGAFIDALEYITEDAFKALAADIMGLPYTKMKFPKIVRYKYICLETFTHKDNSQSINNGTYEFKKDEICIFGDMGGIKDNDGQFLHDRSKFKFLGIIVE